MENLCKVCRSAFSGTDRVFKCEATVGYAPRKFYAHHDTFADLESAANNGCQLCMFLFASLPAYQKKRLHLQPADTKRTAVSPPSSQPPYICYHLDTRGGEGKVECHIRLSNPLGYYLIKTLSLEQVRVSAKPSIEDLIIRNARSATTDSQQSFELALKWMMQCAKYHTKCKESGTNITPASGPIIRFLPTRLIHVGSEDGKPVRLCNTKELPRGILYMTLSHCWGQHEFLALLNRNLAEFMKEIPFSELPKTFQDAIKFTRSTPVKYIWIDSLCIIQDSQADWRNESVQMAEIYSGSFCNLSATNAPDGRVGLFSDRAEAAYESIAIDVISCPEPESKLEESPVWTDVFTNVLSFNKKRKKQKETVAWALESKPAPKGLYIVRDSSAWKKDVEESVLHKRGWVFQERLLAKRALHFTFRQIWFECQEFRACELSPQVSWQRITDHRKTELLGSTEKSESGEPVSSYSLSTLKSWKDMVTDYTSCALTRESDRLIAIAGLARLMKAKMRTNYVAGMWHNDKLAEQLLWERSDDGLTRTVEYQAPSWSWASVNGKVSWHEFDIMSADFDDRTSHPQTSILGVWVKTTDGNEMSQVISGHLQVQGNLYEAKVSPGEIKIGTLTGRRITINETIDSYLIQDDLNDELADTLYCTIFFHTWKGSAIGIALKPMRNRGQFQRVGVFRWGSFDSLGLTKGEVKRKILVKGLYDSCDKKTGKYTFTIV